MTWALPIIGLLLLILVHELGHFLVAKAVGAKATKFYIGFPPALIGRKRGETEYGIGAIPLGGYVRIVGMTRPQPSDLWRVNDAVEEAAGRRSAEAPDRLGDSVGELRDRLGRSDLDAVAPAATAALASLEAEQELLDPKTAAEARKDLDRLAEETDPRAYWRLPVWKRVAIIAAGPLANVLAAVVILAGFYMGGVPEDGLTNRIQSVVAGSAADQAGLQAGDQVVGINGAAVEPEAVRSTIQRAEGAPVILTVQRAGQRVELPAATPEQDDTGWRLGFVLDLERIGTREYSPVEASTEAVSTIKRATGTLLSGMVDIVVGDGRKDLTTPVGIVNESEKTVDSGWFPGVLAMISLALAVFNLLPFLPLDGGHILFALLEKVRGGRPIPRGVFERVSVVGIALMLVLFLFGVQNDWGRLTAP